MSKILNYVVIAGVRYDLVPDKPGTFCDDCDLASLCLERKDSSLCTYFDLDSHFEEHK